MFFTLGSICSMTWTALTSGILYRNIPNDGGLSVLIPYDMDDDMMCVSTYNVVFNDDGTKQDFTELYARIASSQWFKKAYSGKSIGDISEIEY